VAFCPMVFVRTPPRYSHKHRADYFQNSITDIL